MYKVASIEIEGFRGQTKSILLQLKHDANFLIGRNGTGKTTLINLIHATLTVNLSVLRESTFKSVEFHFFSEKSKSHPIVTILKRESEESGEEIVYWVRASRKAPQEEFIFPRFRRTNVLMNGQRRSVNLSRSPNTNRELTDRLSKIYKSTWLSLRRRADFIEEEERNENQVGSESDVDRKLEQVANDLVKFFSRLDRKVSEQTQIFQKEWFLSSLARERTPVTKRAIEKINPSEERAALKAIFEKFGMAPASYEAQLETHVALVERMLQSNRSKDGKEFSFVEILAMLDIIRLHSRVEEWQDLQRRQLEIYLPKTEFIEISSEMLFKKILAVNSGNQVVVQSVQGNIVPLVKLSSGEKQLLIFLGETLLQEQASFIFLADEPELSLHVEWQEELVQNLLRINPNAQVIFATHSPDVVSSFQNNIFKMEELTD